ncbi:hypothetical protein RHGRI_000533 [Rhododendron griersonianum]|uniref:Uncharacterized protein n=1 Tax=Rhododendron griersonianum TaxID=479676 RepID=A0AAV6LHB6_9ERIC|nr:hypothetical protein RHGRI_000533 [Rhododendron griersonianum]
MMRLQPTSRRCTNCWHTFLKTIEVKWLPQSRTKHWLRCKILFTIALLISLYSNSRFRSFFFPPCFCHPILSLRLP